MDPNPSFIFSSLRSSQFYKLLIYHLHLPSCALASYHPLLTTWTSKFDRTPIGPRYLRRVDTQQTNGLANLRQKMPNNSSARRDKSEKKKKRREPTPLVKQVPTENVESFLSRSSADSGFQGDDENFTWESVAGEAVLDDSLSSFSRLSSSAEPKESRSERRKREKELLEKELEDEFDITLSEDGNEEKDSGSRKLSLSSPTQFLDSLATGVLGRSKSKQQGFMERPSALSIPVQALRTEQKGMRLPLTSR
jgi:hypothetical protein